MGAPASVAGPGIATNAARPRRTETSSARTETATSAGPTAPRSRPHGARSAARSSAGTPTSSRYSDTAAARRALATRPTYATSRPNAATSASSSHWPWLATTTYGDADRVDAGEAPGGMHVDAVREEIAGGVRVDRRDLPAGLRAEVRQRPGDRRDPDDPQLRRGEVRLDEDLERPTGVAGHHEIDDPVRAPGLGGLLRREAEQPRLAVGQRPERLGDDGRLGAASADPALDRAVRMDDPARAGLRGGGARHRDDGREDERAAGLGKVGRPGEDPAGEDPAGEDPAGEDSPAGMPGARVAHQAVSPFSFRMAQTFWGVIGMSM